MDADHRLERLPNVPTLKEIGLGGEKIANWFGLAPPAGRPAPIIEKLNNVFIEAAQDPTLRKRLNELDTPIIASTPKEMRCLMEEESTQMQALVKILGLKTQ